MTQRTLDDALTEQERELARVSGRIADSVFRFCQDNPRFHLQELEDHVAAAHGHVTPGSAGRILRDLRRKGWVAYRVVSRSQSLYEIEAT